MSNDTELLIPTPSPDDILQGGPGLDPLPGSGSSDDAAGQNRDGVKTIKIGDREFAVDPDLAEALEDQEFKSRAPQPAQITGLEEIKQKLELLEKGFTSSPVSQEQSVDEIANILYSDPKKALSAFQDSIVKKIEDVVSGKMGVVQSELTRQKQEQGIREFWKGFESSQPGLKDAQILSRAILSEHMSEWGHLPIPKVYERLARLTHDQLRKLGAQGNGNARSGQTPAEGSSKFRQTTATQEKKPEYKSLSTMIGEKRLERVKASRNIPSMKKG